MRRRKAAVALFLSLWVLQYALVPCLHGWGDEGHRLVSRVAVELLPEDMPAFFRTAADRLAFLGPEPDRWRDTQEVYKALRESAGPDHFIDIDQPDDFLALPDDRYQYADRLRAAGKYPKDVGFLPYACLEGFQQVQVMFRMWRDPRNAAEHRQIEENIIYYAGVLGHFVADGAQPLHTTVHYNGWSTSGNPEAFSREPLHWRFEGEYVRARIRAEDFRKLVKPAERLQDPFHGIMRYLLASHETVPELYRLEKKARWEQENSNAESKRFVAARLAAAAQMLADLWYTAWLGSRSP
ncbi:MAG: hypothetical protein FJW35_09380 [Acidobacteria bacterium]|nr:hypothetical protein [Acidobacteriota bacterium]